MINFLVLSTANKSSKLSTLDFKVETQLVTSDILLEEAYLR